MFATIIWEDKKWSIISLRSVLKPRKEVEDYKVGDHVSARFAGKIYAAVIFEIDTDRQALKKKLEDPGFENTLARFLAQQQESRTEAINESEDVEPVKATNNKQKKTDSSKVSDSNKRQNQQAEIMSTNDDQPSSTSYDGKRKLDSSELSVTDQRAMEVLKKRRPACQPVLNPSAVPSLPLITTGIVSTSISLPQTTPSSFSLSNTSTANTTCTPAMVSQSSQYFGFQPQPPVQIVPVTCATASEPSIETQPTYFNLNTQQQMPQSYLSDLMEPLYDGDSPSNNSCHHCCRKIQQLERDIQSFRSKLDDMMLKLNQSHTVNLNVPKQVQEVAQRPAQRPITPDNIPTSSLHQQVMMIVGEEKRLVKAITKAMRGMFSTAELVGCSMKGQATSKVPNPRPGLPEDRRNAIIDVLSRKLEVPVQEVENKMRSALRRLCAMYSGNAE